MSKKVKPAASDEEIDLGIGGDAETRNQNKKLSKLEDKFPELGKGDQGTFSSDFKEGGISVGKLAKPVRQISPTAPNPMPKGMVEIAARFGVDSEDLGELARIGSDSINRAMFEVTRAGLAFMRAQELLSLGKGGDRKSSSFRHSETDDGGGFVEWLNVNGLPHQRVYESMRIAKFVTQLPKDQLDDVLALGKVKVMLLASLPQEVIDNAAESGNDLIDKADLMTVKQLKEEVNSLKRREKNYEAELERSQLQIKRLGETKKRLTEFEPRTEEIRAECMALQLESELPMNSLKKLFEEVLHDDETSSEYNLRLEHVWIAGHVVAATALDMIVDLQRLAKGITMPERALGTHILTSEEAENWLLSRPMIENRHAAEKALRQEKRDADKPQGRGRPKGSKNKADGE